MSRSSMASVLNFRSDDENSNNDLRMARPNEGFVHKVHGVGEEKGGALESVHLAEHCLASHIEYSETMNLPERAQCSRACLCCASSRSSADGASDLKNTEAF